MDSFEGDRQDPLSLHKYLYCAGDPINRIDPSGKEYTGCPIMTIPQITIQQPKIILSKLQKLDTKIEKQKGHENSRKS